MKILRLWHGIIQLKMLRIKLNLLVKVDGHLGNFFMKRELFSYVGAWLHVHKKVFYCAYIGFLKGSFLYDKACAV